MNFIYDILVNFNENLYDFFEWNISDNVAHIRKMPLFKIKTDDLEQMRNNTLRIDLEILKKMENRTEKFTTRDVEKIPYAALFSDCHDVIAVRFNQKGINYQISKLLVDEQEEVLEVCKRCNETALNYEVMNLRNKNCFKTRMQLDKMNYLLRTLNRLEKNNDIDKLKYLYFECFDEKQDSLKTIIDELKRAINDDRLEKVMYDFFKMISIN